jgi:hypothetical protein
MVFAVTGVFAQQISVKSFRKLETDLDARVYHPKTDQNGDVCAIIKVVTTQTGFSWDPDGLGMMGAIPKVGEYWLYVPFGAKRLSIHHPQLGILRDYTYPLPIEKATAYEMVLTTGKVTTKVEEIEIESQWLIINSDPADADVYINDQPAGKTPYQNELPVGKYTWRVQKELYLNDAGIIELIPGADKQKVEIKLKKNFGNIQLSTSPENGASVSMNGIPTGKKTPCTFENLPVGEYTFTAGLDMYETSTQKVSVLAGDVNPVVINMNPIFANVSVRTEPSSDIFINGEFKNNDVWKGRLRQGVYTFEAKKDKHAPAIEKKTIQIGQDLEFVLRPTPRFGVLKITTVPIEAQIKIDEKIVGTSPVTLKNTLIGNYTVELSLKGYETKTLSANIVEGQTVSLNVPLVKIGTEEKKKTEIIAENNTPKNKPVEKIIMPKNPSGLFIIGGISNPLVTNSDGSVWNNGYSYSLRVGAAKKIGFYGAFTTNFSNVKFDYTYGYLPEEYYSSSIISSSYNRFGIGGGLLLKLKPVMLYAGGGWGYYKHYVSTNLYKYLDESLYKEAIYGDKNSFSGLETEVGLIFNFKPICISFGVTSIQFRYNELKAGIGIVL